MAQHLRIMGLVQGVGYRASLETLANALGLRGWVRNRHDGSVEAVVDGEPEAVERLITWARQGPPGARVDAVERNAVEEAEIGKRFVRKPSA